MDTAVATRRRSLLWALAAAFSLAFAPTAGRADEALTVFAAASFRDVLEDVAEGYQVRTGTEIRLVLAASSVLARQIDAGAPADLFVSANEDWVTWLADRGRIEPAEIRVIAGNRLVIALAPGVGAQGGAEALLSRGRFAMGDPAHVPAGVYAKSALESLGLWTKLSPRAVFTENVRIALEFVRRGEVGAAIVYASDLKLAPELVKALEFPEHSHPPIRYGAAPIKNGDGKAREFLDYLAGPEGRQKLQAFGFSTF
jgi:molybdate transport system substrate-binding protein